MIQSSLIFGGTPPYPHSYDRNRANAASTFGKDNDPFQRLQPRRDALLFAERARKLVAKRFH